MASRKTLSLYSAVDPLRIAFVNTLTPCEITDDTGITFDELISKSFLALLSKLPWGQCFPHVDTEGNWVFSLWALQRP